MPMDSVQAVSEMLPDGLVVVDEHQVIRFANRRAEEILQLPRECLVGYPIREGMPLTDSDGNNWWDLTDPWVGLATRKGHREKLLWTEKGVEVLVTARYIRRGRGAPVHRVVMAFRDALARQRTEADHAALISTLAHELRSPLTSVKGSSTGSASATRRSVSSSRPSRRTRSASPGSSPTCSTCPGSTPDGSTCAARWCPSTR